MENNANLKNNLLQNVHQSIALPTKSGETYFVHGDYSYFHYKCDGIDDVGWGCGYRTLQTMCSQIKSRRNLTTVHIPNIHDIQRILIEIGDKEAQFLDSRDWIGSIEIGYVLDHLLGTPCKILHVGHNKSLNDCTNEIKTYLIQYGGIIMMGGEMDNASKGICGLHIDQIEGNIYFLIVDPHFKGIAESSQQLQDLGFVKWHHISDFNNFNCFYNLCMPLIK